MKSARLPFLKHSMSMSQEQFTLQYGISLSAEQKLNILGEMIAFVRAFRPDLLKQDKKQTTRR